MPEEKPRTFVASHFYFFRRKEIFRDHKIVRRCTARIPAVHHSRRSVYTLGHFPVVQRAAEDSGLWKLVDTTASGISRGPRRPSLAVEELPRVYGRPQVCELNLVQACGARRDNVDLSREDISQIRGQRSALHELPNARHRKQLTSRWPNRENATVQMVEQFILYIGVQGRYGFHLNLQNRLSEVDRGDF